MNRYPTVYIQYGNVTIRDSGPPHTTPCRGRRRRGRAGALGVGWGGVGVDPLWIYFHNIGYKILDIYSYIPQTKTAVKVGVLTLSQ